MAEELARNLVSTIDVVDPDVVEAVNLTRSTYLGDDIDQPKVEALARHLRRSRPSEDELRVIV